MNIKYSYGSYVIHGGMYIVLLAAMYEQGYWEHHFSNSVQHTRHL